jgi:2-polyprenyl-6-methoxyphenol hydroxylase-like FAD-dependent oxidoreductase
VYGAIIVGARCAGSPLAMLLARQGHRVLLLDRASFPSNMTMSTHLIHQPGIARLKRWGLFERLAVSGCPPLRSYSYDVGEFTLTGCPPPAEGVSEAYARAVSCSIRFSPTRRSRLARSCGNIFQSKH